MIELIADGEIETTTGGGIDYTDGHDPMYGSVEVTARREVHVDVEFPQGHVNLEGFAPSVLDRTVTDAIGHLVDHGADVANYELVGSTWDVILVGEWHDWVQQAHRYVVERPAMSILDCLDYFRGWDETDDEALAEATRRAKKVELASYNVGEFTDGDWADLRLELNNFEHVSVPESYAD